MMMAKFGEPHKRHPSRPNLPSQTCQAKPAKPNLCRGAPGPAQGARHVGALGGLILGGRLRLYASVLGQSVNASSSDCFTLAD